MSVYVRLLGTPAVRHRGEWRSPPTTKVIALAYHLAFRGDWVDREELAYLFWPDVPEANARANLRKLLARLRRDLPPATELEGERTRLRWSVPNDVGEFHEAIEAGRLHEALELYRGPLLQGFRLSGATEFDGWLERERDALERRRRRAAFALADALADEGAHPRAAEVLEALARSEPLDERILQRRLQALQRGGQTLEALALFDTFARQLEKEFGSAPQPDTLDLVAAIRAREEVAAATPPTRLGAHPAPAARPVVSIPGPEAGPLLVGRQVEVARLEAGLDAALAGRSGFLFVTGSAGEGKTTLLQAFARRAQRDHPELVTATGNCNAYTGSGDPYLPFREILGTLTGDLDARAIGALVPDSADRLRRLLPAAVRALLDVGPDLLGPLVPLQPLLDRSRALAPDAAATARLRERAMSAARAPGVDPRSLHQAALSEQVARVVEALSTEAPLLLLIDDLQWIDSGSATLLLHLGKRLADRPVLVVGAYRPAEVADGRDGERHPLAQVVGELRRDHGDVVLDLGRSEGREGRTFVDALIDTEPNALDEGFRDTLWRLTRGQPLFTGELLRGMQERGDLLRDEQGRWTAASGLDWETLPARVEGAIGERIARLSPALRELLDLASVEGEEFSAEVVARVLGRDLAEVVRDLGEELDRTHLLVRTLGVRREGGARLSRYRFRHILIQRYLYGGLDPVGKVLRHEAIAETLETLHDGALDTVAAQLAWHYTRAERPERATVHLERAGDLALRSAALEEAERYYRAALDALEGSGGDAHPRARTQRKLGECLWVIGRSDEALSTFGRAYALFEALGAVEEAGAVERLRGRVHWERGDRERSLACYHHALELLRQAPPGTELAWAISSISQMHMLASEYDEAIAQGERALALAEELGAERVILHAMNNIGTALLATGEHTRGERLLRESGERALALNLLHDAMRAFGNLSENLGELGRFAEARALLETNLERAERHQISLFIDGATAMLAHLEWQLGAWRSAMARRERLTRRLDGDITGYARAVGAILLGRTAVDLGRPGAALEILEGVSGLVARRDEPQTTAPHLGGLARALGGLGRDDEADRVLVTLLEQLDHESYVRFRVGTDTFLFAARWLAERGRSGEARRYLGHLERAIDQCGPSPPFEAALHEGRGRLASLAGALEQAIDETGHAVGVWRSLGCPLDLARASTLFGRLLRERGDLAGARHALDEAHGLIGGLGDQLGAADRRDFLASPLAVELKHERGALAGTQPPGER